MQQGQILVNEDGEKRKILGVCGVLYGLSDPGEKNYNNFSHWCSKKDLEERGWSLLEEPWRPTLSELYWYVDSDGEFMQTNWGMGGMEEHDFRLLTGNVHQTSKSAEAYKQKMIERMGSKE